MKVFSIITIIAVIFCCVGCGRADEDKGQSATTQEPGFTHAVTKVVEVEEAIKEMQDKIRRTSSLIDLNEAVVPNAQAILREHKSGDVVNIGGKNVTWEQVKDDLSVRQAQLVKLKSDLVAQEQVLAKLTTSLDLAKERLSDHASQVMANQESEELRKYSDLADQLNRTVEMEIGNGSASSGK